MTVNNDDKAETRPPPFVVRSGYVHRPRPEWDYYCDDDDDEGLGPGWGPSVGVPAAALFPWLKREDR